MPRRRRRTNANDTVLFFIIIIIIAACVIWFLTKFWLYIIIGAIIILSIYVFINWNKWKVRRLRNKVNKLEAERRLKQDIRYYEDKLKRYK